MQRFFITRFIALRPSKEKNIFFSNSATKRVSEDGGQQTQNNHPCLLLHKGRLNTTINSVKKTAYQRNKF